MPHIFITMCYGSVHRACDANPRRAQKNFLSKDRPKSKRPNKMVKGWWAPPWMVASGWWEASRPAYSSPSPPTPPSLSTPASSCRPRPSSEVKIEAIEIIFSLLQPHNPATIFFFFLRIVCIQVISFFFFS